MFEEGHAEKIMVFDTTLRDGQQSPGAGMSYHDNLRYAEIARNLGVDILEAGFPSASLHDFAIVRDISKMMADFAQSPIVCGLTQCREKLVLETIRALLPAQAEGRARVHIYLPVDPELMSASLGQAAQNHDRLIAEVSRMIGIAVDAGMEVEFSPEGYSRQAENFDFTTQLIIEAVRAGARVINCPDTIGIGSPLQGEDFFVRQMNRHAQIIDQVFPDNDVIWSTHNHNDLGLATINSILAVTDGPARQVECTVNGIGERAGNASLEQIVMNIDVHLKGRFYTGIVTRELLNISNFVADHMVTRQPHGPVVHDNSFRHSSGGHTNAILGNPEAYHVFPPENVGAKLSFCFGPLSGSNHAQDVIVRAGYLCDDSERVEICQYIKDCHSDRRKGITDQELVETYRQFRKPIKAETIGYSKLANRSSFHMNGEFFGTSQIDHEFSAEGADSAVAVLEQAVRRHIPDLELIDYKSRSTSSGAHAPSQASIEIRMHGQTFIGVAQDTDIEKSALLAFIDAINEGYIETRFRTTTDIGSNI